MRPNDGHAPNTARLARGVSARLRFGAFVSRGLLCVFMALLISFVPLNAQFERGLRIERTEACANPAVLVGAGAGLAALAAELGISETALIAGVCAIGVGCTGLAFYNASRTDVALPGWVPWDDLTPQQKQDWVGQDGTSKDYYDQQIAWWALQMGLLEQTPNGDIQPPEEPDPGNDPNGNSRWHKARNTVAALALTGGAVALNEGLNCILDNAENAVKDLLFGGPDVPGGSIDIDYESNYAVGGIANLYFATIPSGTTTWIQGGETRSYTFGTDQWISYGPDMSVNGPTTLKVPVNFFVSNVTMAPKTGQDLDGAWSYNQRVTGSNLGYKLRLVNGEWENYATASSMSDYCPSWNNTPMAYLNANYAGRYTFSGTDAYYENGSMHGTYSLNGIDYGQMNDTPTGLTQNILNQTNFNNWVNNYTDDATEGFKRALTIPSNFNDPTYTPSYEDFVVVTPEEDITPVPDDEPIYNPDGPNPPEPTPEQQFRDDYGQKVGELLSRPFNQLFPFCLIGDLNALTSKIEDAIYPSGGMSAQSTVTLNGTIEFDIPLEDFGIEGMDAIELDLTPVSDFAQLIRPWTTSIFIVLLLVGTFRFFLTRGGE